MRPFFSFVVGLVGLGGNETVPAPTGPPGADVPLSYLTYPPVPSPTPESIYNPGFFSQKMSAEPTPGPTQRKTPMPTSRPSPRPSPRPTQKPTTQITRETAIPTRRTTRRPTPAPTRPIARQTPGPTPRPTSKPTRKPTRQPTMRPTPAPTARPTRKPTKQPTKGPTAEPTRRPTERPTRRPTREPTNTPTPQPTRPISRQTTRPTPQPTNRPTTMRPTPVPVADVFAVSVVESASGTITYRPGKLTQNLQAGLNLSAGLGAKVIARSGKKVNYNNGSNSTRVFHGRPDGGATFPDIYSSNNKGGWVYVSNSEIRLTDPGGAPGMGGVGAITFNKRGKIIDYKMVLVNTTWNCGGGKTPWGSWVSAEEQPGGKVFQVDPFGKRAAEKMTLGSEGGTWESFTYDLRNMSEPHFYLTEDASRGAVQRFTPDKVQWNQDPWKMLHRSGTTEYLKLIPNVGRTGGRYRWVKSRLAARTNAFQFYQNVEGIDCDGESVYFVSKKLQQLFELNLADGTYTNSSTVRGKFNGRPDQIARILANGNEVKHDDDLLYFTEESRMNAGVHGRNPAGKYVTIFESPVYKGECAGIFFSPDGMHLYVAYQDEGVLLDIFRLDGFPFHAKTLNIKYHQNVNNNNAGGGGGTNNAIAAAGGGNGQNANAVAQSRNKKNGK